ncbi:hypothetical protein AURDEDRAFT_55668 [Auricularia subglabra TFB-10046 SS5]|nr:hypothetical protein AURDEDRAFT_55668 [Auricularia subglabra TFB-10046 SS5]
MQAMIESDGAISDGDALALATIDLERIFSLEAYKVDPDMVTYVSVDMFSVESKVVAVVATMAGRVSRTYSNVSSG